MTRAKVLFTAFAALGLALLTTAALSRTAAAGKYSYGYENDDSNRLHWALVEDDHNSSTSLSDLDDLDRLKDSYGRRFLYIRDGEDRYSIKDRGMMERAREAMKPVQEAGREIGKAVGEKVSYSMRRSGASRERSRVERRLARVERRLSRLDESDEGEDQDSERQELENERQELRQQLEQMKDDRHEQHASEERQADLDAATERASRHMREATRNMDRQLRAILKESISRKLAARIGDEREVRSARPFGVSATRDWVGPPRPTTSISPSFTASSHTGWRGQLLRHASIVSA